MFKVGTRVVYISKYKTKKILHVVDKCVGRTCIRVSNIARKETFLQHQSLLRKATDEELAAGHRIDHIGDVNEMGEDSYIENNVSPNYKVEVKL